MRRGVDPDEEPITATHVTPLVDITLVLLIVSMMATACAASRSIPIAPANRATRAAPEMIVTLDARGALFIDGAEASSSELEERARVLSRRHPDVHATIAADRAVSHGRVVQVIAVLRTGGVTHYGVRELSEREISGEK